MLSVEWVDVGLYVYVQKEVEIFVFVLNRLITMWSRKIDNYRSRRPVAVGVFV